MPKTQERLHRVIQGEIFDLLLQQAITGRNAGDRPEALRACNYHNTNSRGINTAFINGTFAIGIVDRNQNKQERKESNSMLNKLNKRRGGFTLVEIMIVVAIIALLAAIAVPGFLRARKRSQASRIMNDLRMIDSAVDQYAIENNKQDRRHRRHGRLDQLPEEGHEPLQLRARTSSRQRLRSRRPWTRCRKVPATHLRHACRTWPTPRSGRPTIRKDLTIHSPVIRLSRWQGMSCEKQDSKSQPLAPRTK